MPQGGIDEGEDPAKAALRELARRPASARSRSIAESPRLVHLRPAAGAVGKAWGGRYRGQRQKWFAVRFVGDDAEIDIAPAGGHPAEFDAWRWARIGELIDLIVPFKREVYARCSPNSLTLQAQAPEASRQWRQRVRNSFTIDHSGVIKSWWNHHILCHKRADFKQLMVEYRCGAHVPNACDALPYRPCVGIMLINDRGRVWVGRRSPKWLSQKATPIWQMPQGGIDPGEAPEHAALRELEEETGVRNAHIIGADPGLAHLRPA